MFNKLINEKVDIYTFPDSIDNENKANEITIGDLHGNAMKLLFMLVKLGIATIIDKTDYQKLVETYKTPVNLLKKGNLDEFNSILANMKFHTKSKLRLLGDELADRGNNDYFTLKILEKLNTAGVPVEIILSNHSVEFIEAYEKQDRFEPQMLFLGFAHSMQRLQNLIDKRLVSKKEILEIVDKAYKPTLKVISYSLDLASNEINIFSHAAIGLNTIKNLAEKFNINYDDTTAEKLAQTIDKINESFQKKAKTNTIHTLYARKNMEDGFNNPNTDLSDSPIEFSMWNRRYDVIDRPANYKGYKLYFVHGHDTPKISNPNAHIHNLDNKLGKGNTSKGIYTVLCIDFGVGMQKNETIVLSPDQKKDSTPKNKMHRRILNGTTSSHKQKLFDESDNGKEVKKLLASIKNYLEKTEYAHLEQKISKEIATDKFNEENLNTLREYEKEIKNTYFFGEINANLEKLKSSLTEKEFEDILKIVFLQYTLKNLNENFLNKFNIEVQKILNSDENLMNRFEILLKNNDDKGIPEGELANLTLVLKEKSENKLAILRELNEKPLTKEDSSFANTEAGLVKPIFFTLPPKYRKVTVLENKFLFQP